MRGCRFAIWAAATSVLSLITSESTKQYLKGLHTDVVEDVVEDA